MVMLLSGILAVRLFGFIESFVFYFPSREEFANEPGVIDVTFSGPDGRKLHGWLLVPANAGAGSPAVLHVHGNAGNVSSHLAYSRFLADHGFVVFIFDYRGYGRSEVGRSRPRRDRMMEDTRAALETLITRPEVDRSRIGVYGVSIGSVFATALAAERPDVRAVVAVAPFSGWANIAHTHFPIVGPMLVRGGLDPIDSCAALGDRPLMLVHGSLDDIIPPEHSARIERAARAKGVKVTRLVVPEAGHNDIVFQSEATKQAVAAFFKESLR